MVNDIKKQFRDFLSESDELKAKRQLAIDISADKKLNKKEILQFNFKIMEYKLDKAEYPKHPSAELNNTFSLEITTNKGSLETKFVYEYSIYDYLDSSGKSAPRIEMRELIEFEAFLNDELIKLDKGTAKKISNNYKIDQKIIKLEFVKAFDLLNYTNYKSIKDKLDIINKENEEYSKFADLMSKSDEISKIVKKYNHPIQKMVYYKNIIFLADGYLNERMRKDIKKYLEIYDTELWSINDTKKRKEFENNNNFAISELRKICTGKLIYISRGNEISIKI